MSDEQVQSLRQTFDALAVLYCEAVRSRNELRAEVRWLRKFKEEHDIAIENLSSRLDICGFTLNNGIDALAKMVTDAQNRMAELEDEAQLHNGVLLRGHYALDDAGVAGHDEPVQGRWVPLAPRVKLLAKERDNLRAELDAAGLTRARTE